MLNVYNKLPRLNEGERKIVRYFMFRHKVNIPGKGVKQGYSLSAVPIEKFKKVKSKDVVKTEYTSYQLRSECNSSFV